MVTQAHTAERTAPGAGPAAVLPALTPRQRLAAVVAILALAGIGLAIMPSASDAALYVPVEGSSSGDFLQPGAETSSGPVRITYETAAGVESLSNGGVIPLTDELQMEVSIAPYPPATFDVDVDLFLTDSDGTPIENASIVAIWDMIVMWHGPFETEFTNLGGGHYAAPFDLFMFGPWELMTHVTAPGHELPDPLPLSIYVWPE